MKYTLITGMMMAVLTGSLPAIAQTGITGSTSAPPAIVTAEITLAQRSGEKQSREIELAGREGNRLSYREKGGPREASLNIDLATVTSLDFDFQVESEVFSRALANRNWLVVATTLWPIITPLMPYLDIKDNNAADLAYVMANAMLKVADGHHKANAEDKARRLYLEANKVFEVLSKAEWFEDAPGSRLKSALCFIAMTNYPQAEAQLKATASPEIGDATWGLYWYVQAVLKTARGELREAMNAVTKSLVFENKDIDVFPDALMLSARLYEELLEPYRARDVYYEVAKLFPDTEWATAAREHLKFIMDKGLTKGQEKSQVEMVFFGLKEDLNTKVTALLKGEDHAAAPEESDTALEIDEADMQSGNKGATPEAGKAPVNSDTAAKQAGKASAGAKAIKTDALK